MLTIYEGNNANTEAKHRRMRQKITENSFLFISNDFSRIQARRLYQRCMNCDEHQEEEEAVKKLHMHSRVNAHRPTIVENIDRHI